MVDGMLVLAHRGANRQAAENTAPAMARAPEPGADGVELDVLRVADGALAVRHDAETPGGPLGGLTAADLAAVLPAAPLPPPGPDVSRHRLVNVEVKDPAPRAVDELVTLLREREGVDDVLVSSFHIA